MTAKEPDVLLIFVKHPAPGEVKTRLAREIGARAAAEVGRLLAEHALRSTRPEGNDYRRRVFWSPPEAEAAMAAWLPGEVLLPQVPGDLGRRMAEAFEHTFGAGARRSVLIGTDVPALGRGQILTAFDALARHDVVLGPARDGGYYLVGLSRPQPGLFEGVPWGTAEVLDVTLERARSLRLSVAFLETLDDVDTIADVRRSWPLLVGLLDHRPGLRHRLAEAVGLPPTSGSGG